jgi:hypothetical protein
MTGPIKLAKTRARNLSEDEKRAAQIVEAARLLIDLPRAYTCDAIKLAIEALDPYDDMTHEQSRLCVLIIERLEAALK